MKNFLRLLFLSTFLFSCSNPNDVENNSITGTDPFRENVLKMREVGLLKSVSDKQLDSLILVCKKDSVNGLKNLLVKSGEMLQLDLNLSGKSPADVYQRICSKIGEKFPDLKNDSLTCQYLPDEPGGKDTGWMMMHQKIGNETYTKKLYYFNDWPIDETFCKIYNSRLASENKDYRMYLVTFMCTNCYHPIDDSGIKEDIGTMGLLKLTKAQANVLLPMEGLAIDPEDEFTAFSPSAVESKIKQFETTGILQKNDSAWWRLRKQDMRENTVYGMEDMYDFLDTLFCTASFDTLNDYNPYEDMLKSLAEISRGKFNPGAIRDEIQDRTIRTVRFTFKGKSYTRDAEEKGGVLFPGIIDDVNNALEENKVDGAFYTVLSRDNIVMVIYLDNSVAEKAKASGFFTEFIKGVPDELKGRYANNPSM